MKVKVFYALINNLPHHRNGAVSFNYPITFEEHGGLVVGTSSRCSTVAYTSTPDESASARLLDQYGDSSKMIRGMDTMGAGDAAAAMAAICNTIDAKEFIVPHLEGREVFNHILQQYAQTIFLSAISRIVGAFVIRTHSTQLKNLRLDSFAPLFRETSIAALNVARSIVLQTKNYSMNELQGLGIKVVTWKLGSIVNPDN